VTPAHHYLVGPADALCLRAPAPSATSKVTLRPQGRSVPRLHLTIHHGRAGGLIVAER
jgi:hypothetical protein